MGPPETGAAAPGGGGQRDPDEEDLARVPEGSPRPGLTGHDQMPPVEARGATAQNVLCELRAVGELS